MQAGGRGVHLQGSIVCRGLRRLGINNISVG